MRSDSRRVAAGDEVGLEGLGGEEVAEEGLEQAPVAGPVHPPPVRGLPQHRPQRPPRDLETKRENHNLGTAGRQTDRRNFTYDTC